MNIIKITMLLKIIKFQHSFSLNVWTGIIKEPLIGPFILTILMDGLRNLQFLPNALP